jgi:dTDP-4-dehydrorhamnose 3,5-epimerase
MKFLSTIFSDAWLIDPRVFTDKRGFFMESYSKRSMQEKGITAEFVQDNHSKSVDVNVIRGLHFQYPPHAQAKFIRVTRGAIFDVIVDLRHGSPTCRQWQGFELTEENHRILYVPRGFAHGFCTLSMNSEVLYKADNFYAPDYDGGIRWNDPSIGISWPTQSPILSDKDAKLPFLKDIRTPF